MTKTTSRTTLWRNLSALMDLRYKEEHLGKLAQQAGIGASTMTRIKECNTSTGVDNLDKLAAALSVQAWQLLMPGLDTSKLSCTPQEPKTPAQADAENLALVIAAIPRDQRKAAVLEATQILIGYLAPKPSPAKSSLNHDETQASTR